MKNYFVPGYINDTQFSLKPNFKIIDDVLHLPVDIYYTMEGFYVGDLNMNNKIPLEWTFQTYKKTVDELIEQFIRSDEHFGEFVDYIEHVNADKSEIKVPIIKKDTTCSFFRNPNGTPSTEYTILSSEKIHTSEEVSEMIKNHPKFEFFLNRLKKNREENMKIQQMKDSDSKYHMRMNLYQQWKFLNEKYKKGEFSEFETNC